MSPSACWTPSNRSAFSLLHPEVLGYFRRKASDYDRWLRGMRRLQMAVSGR
jgi:hypothetical protein